MQSSLDGIVETVSAYLPNIAAATAILVGGWIVARILSAVARKGLERTELDNRLADWIGGGDGGAPPVEGIAARTVFYLVMLFVLVAFFQALQLDLITQPLNALLTRLSEFAPRLLGAAGLLIVAWVIATVLRRLVSGALSATDLDRRLGETTEAGDALPLSHTLGEAVYWLVFLLFLPAVLGALAIEGLLEPVQSLTDQVLSFLPNLLAAALVFIVGWFVARLVQRIVTNLLAAAGVDGLPERLGLDMMGSARLSHLVGLVFYVFILIPVVISALNALALDAITAPASAMLAQILEAIPGLFAAGLLLAIAYAAGRLVGSLVTKLLSGAGFDGVLARLGLERGEGTGVRTLSEMAGSLTLVAIMVFAAVEAADMVGFTSLAEVLGELIVFGGQALLGVVVFGVGLWLADLAASTVRDSGVGHAETLALAARVSILILVGAMALRQMGLGERIIELAFGLSLGAVAVATALAFGLGSRDVAGEQVRRWMDGSER